MKRGMSVLLAALLVPALVVPALGCGNDGTAAVPDLSLWTGDETVSTLSGEVLGFDDRADTWVWRAIPFARPPVGPLRWKAPVDPDPWADVREETEYCSECPQYDIDNSVLGDEDCLYLNVWRPQSDGTDLPVYFWIHGGGNSMGSASDETYNGARIAGRSDMVVVSTNYRLGPLGWFAHSSLRSGEAGSEADDSGNFGTLDLIQALEWVRDNIEAFGGDPDNVTMAGESAGAINVLSLMISPPADDLFHRAIIQSGIPIANPVSVGEESARDVTLKLLVDDGTAVDEADAEARLEAMAGEEVESYLRSKTPAELLAGYESASFGMIAFPFIFEDGTVIPETGFETLERGTYPGKVPVIIGSNKYETKVFLFMDPQFVGKDDLYQVVTAYTSDLWKVIGVDEVARVLSSHDDQPEVFAYQFLWGAAAQAGEGVIPDPWGLRLGACHGLDIPFFFGSGEFFGPLSPLVFTEQNRPGRVALSDLMMGYAAQFAWTGDPNRPESSFAWSPWSNGVDAPKSLLLDAGLEFTEISMSGVELTESDVKATVTPEVLDLLESESLGFLTEFVDRNWLEKAAP
jgi:para-nitrobenzyl esterase